MQLREFKLESDYANCAAWWAAHNWSAVPAGVLPPTGIVVENQGVKVCAGWLYFTDSPLAWLEWIVSNPETDATIRDKCLDKLIDSLIFIARTRGAQGVFSSSNNPKLIARLERHGFQQSPDKGIVHLFRSF